MEPILTARVGTNADQFPDVLRLYVPLGSHILDMTYGRGVFWKKVPDGYSVTTNDLDPTTKAQTHEDFRHMSFQDAMFDAVVLDPPYLYIGGFKTLRGYFHTAHPNNMGSSSYGNQERAAKGIYGVPGVDQMYVDGMFEAHRLLKRRGKLILKCMDQVMSGQQVWAHEVYGQYATQMGFLRVDLFVLMRPGKPLMRHKPENQKHARHNHSYFLVFQKR